MPARPYSPNAITYRARAMATLDARTGVYALCDLDRVPIYVGQSVDGIRARVRRHLTSARSDIIANRQIDVWEIAWVMAWPVEGGSADRNPRINDLEAGVFHHFHATSALMNGSVPTRRKTAAAISEPAQIVQVMSDEEIARRIDPSARLPRQIEHYGRLVDHYLTVKASPELRLSMEAHFERLQRYHRRFLEQVGPGPVGSEDAKTAQGELL